MRLRRLPGQGGAIENIGTLTIHGTRCPTTPPAEGHVDTAIGAVTIDNQSVLSYNTARTGGTINGSVGTNRAVTLKDCTLSDNAAWNGGAVRSTAAHSTSTAAT